MIHAERFELIHGIPSDATCETLGETLNNLPFIPLHEFEAMGHNYNIERDMLAAYDEFSAYLDDCERNDQLMDAMENGENLLLT